MKIAIKNEEEGLNKVIRSDLNGKNRGKNARDCY
jgi:hypothetical protein